MLLYSIYIENATKYGREELGAYDLKFLLYKWKLI